MARLLGQEPARRRPTSRDAPDVLCVEKTIRSSSDKQIAVTPTLPGLGHAKNGPARILPLNPSTSIGLAEERGDDRLPGPAADGGAHSAARGSIDPFIGISFKLRSPVVECIGVLPRTECANSKTVVGRAFKEILAANPEPMLGNLNEQLANLRTPAGK